MSEFDRLLGTDFDGRPSADPEGVIYDGLDDLRHRERVPGLIRLMNDSTAPARDRFLACVALTTWGEPAGYETIISTAKAPKVAPWYEILIDRKFSVDSTFAQFAVAIGDSDEISESKGTLRQRLEALRSLVCIADTEYFEDRLGEIFDQDSTAAVLDDITETVRRGVASLANGGRQRFDVATQLVDLAAACAPVDGRVAAGLAMDVLNVSRSGRTLVHVVTVLHRSQALEVKQLGEYISTVGDEQISRMARDALSSRHS
ncbi:hypothetical protein ACFQVC_04635 [Streptomyces monticola]|uniref:HEAT repeat domain-containing protein n=1 Tax=Streptomyces monticola TaxID=2666263 RepID=A0ABW2JE18_9ACTN